MTSKLTLLLVAIVIIGVSLFILVGIPSFRGDRETTKPTTPPLEVHKTTPTTPASPPQTPVTRVVEETTTPRLEVYQKPFFTLETDSFYIAVPQGGSFSFKIRVEPWNNYSGDVELDFIGVQMYDIGVDSPMWLYDPKIVSVELEPRVIAAGGEAEVSVRISKRLPPGRYTLAISGSSGGVKNILAVPFDVYAYPSYVIVPRVDKPVAVAGEEIVIYFDVKPLGDFNRTVKLRIADYRGLEVRKFENNTGIPPFTARAVVVLSEYLWTDFQEGDSRRRPIVSNKNVYIVVEGGRNEARSVVFFGMEEIERPGFIGIITLPIRLVIGVGIGVVTGFSLGIVLPALTVNEYFVATASLFVPELVVKQVTLEEGFTSVNLDMGYFNSFLRVFSIGRDSAKKGSILLPSAEIHLSRNESIRVPFIAYTAGLKASIEAVGVYRVRSVVPPFEEKIETTKLDVDIVESGRDYVKGFIDIPGNTTFTEVYVRLVDEKGNLIDQVLLEVSYITWTRRNVLVYGSPGERIITVIPVPTPLWSPVVEENTYRYLPRITEQKGVEWIIYTSFEEVGGRGVQIKEAGPIGTDLIANVDVKPLSESTAIVIVDIAEGAPSGYYNVGVNIKSQHGVFEVARLYIVVKIQGEEIPPYRR